MEKTTKPCYCCRKPVEEKWAMLNFKTGLYYDCSAFDVPRVDEEKGAFHEMTCDSPKCINEYKEIVAFEAPLWVAEAMANDARAFGDGSFYG